MGNKITTLKISYNATITVMTILRHQIEERQEYLDKIDRLQDGEDHFAEYHRKAINYINGVLEQIYRQHPYWRPGTTPEEAAKEILEREKSTGIREA